MSCIKAGPGRAGCVLDTWETAAGRSSSLDISTISAPGGGGRPRFGRGNICGRFSFALFSLAVGRIIERMGPILWVEDRFNGADRFEEVVAAVRL